MCVVMSMMPMVRVDSCTVEGKSVGCCHPDGGEMVLRGCELVVGSQLQISHFRRILVFLVEQSTPWSRAITLDEQREYRYQLPILYLACSRIVYVKGSEVKCGEIDTHAAS